jgi:hypothetical protein
VAELEEGMGKKVYSKENASHSEVVARHSYSDTIRERPGAKDDREVRRLAFDLDLDFLLIAFSWVGRIETVRNVQEREEWVHFEREALDCVLRTFPKTIRQNSEYSGTPYQADSQVFKRVASFLLQSRPNEHPEELWKPILDLGAAAHYWVGNFLNSFLGSGLNDAPAGETFKRIWRSMLDYAFASAKWSRSNWIYASDLWQDLLGQVGPAALALVLRARRVRCRLYSQSTSQPRHSHSR